ncbi:MAG TPA: hypothetical protein VFU16_13190 [Solirubrobacterales bacterium]|nr:hypothetical protein [Solirubrobacterales bacterium]
MKAREVDRKLREADRFSAAEMEWLELGPAEAALAEAILAEPATPAALAAAPEIALAPPPPAGRNRRGLLGVAGLAAAAVAAAVILLLGGGASKSPSPAYGAALVRFAESTPLLLLEGPGWRVEDVTQAFRGRYMPPSMGEGRMEFVTGKPIPPESIRVTPVGKPERLPGSRYPVHTKQWATGMLPPAVRQRKVELRWFHGSLAETISMAREMPHPHGQGWIELPVLETTAQVDTRAEFFVNLGGPGDRQMTALWSEGGYVLEMKAAVPDLGAFEERLDWLTKVDSQTWLDAMPAQVVKAADHDAAVREMLKGIPLPATFEASLIPDEGLTTNRYQVAGAVTGIVSCLWFRQWGEARRSGDRAAEAEAEKAMATSRRWPILREMARDGGDPPVWELAAAMPSGKGKRGWRLLPQAEALGCARYGIPVLPWKQKRQDEREAGGKS